MLDSIYYLCKKDIGIYKTFQNAGVVQALESFELYAINFITTINL